MEERYTYTPVYISKLNEKKRRCNTTTWLQIFCGIVAIGGIITAAGSTSIVPIIGGISVAVASVGVFFIGCYKDYRSCLKCCCGTSLIEDMNFDKTKKEKKVEEKNKIIGQFFEEIDEKIDEFSPEDMQDMTLALEPTLYELQHQNTNSGKKLLKLFEEKIKPKLEKKFGNEQPLLMDEI